MRQASRALSGLRIQSLYVCTLHHPRVQPAKFSPRAADAPSPNVFDLLDSLNSPIRHEQSLLRVPEVGKNRRQRHHQ